MKADSPRAGVTRVIKLPRGTWPAALAFDRHGRLWVAETSADAVAELRRDGRIVQHRLGEATNTDVSDMVFADDGNLWFAGFELVGWITPAGQVHGYQLGVRAGERPEVGLPTAMARGPDGDAWYTSAARPPAIKRITADGLIRTYALPADAHATEFGGIAADGEGGLWFTQKDATGNGHAAIGRLDPAGAYRRYPLSGKAPAAGRVAAAANGGVWFTEPARYAIGRMWPNGRVRQFPLKPGTVPADLIAGRRGTLWFTTRHAIGRIAAGAVKLWPIRGAENLARIAQAPDGALWVTDPETDTLRRFAPSPA